MLAPKIGFLDSVSEACRHAWYVTGLFSCTINLFMLTMPIYMLQIYDRVITSRSYDTLLFLTLIALIAIMIQALIDIARGRVLVHLSSWLDRMLSPEALQKCPDELLAGNNYGPQALRDITNLRQFLAGPGMMALFDIPWVPIYLIVVYMLHPVLGVFATISVIVLFAFAVWNELATRHLLNQANSQNINSQQFIDASLRNPEVIQAMGMMPNIINHWKKSNTPVLTLQASASNISGIILSISKFTRTAVQVGVLGIGAYLVIKNELTGGSMVAASILLGRALAPIEQSISFWKPLISARQSYQRLKNHFTQHTRITTEIALPAPKGLLVLENVFYRIPAREQPILMNISLQLNPGKILAVVGNSGAGKSSLSRLIVGAVKASGGQVRLDGADIYSWNRQDFGQYIGYLPQDIELFPGTIKDNIARMGEIDDKAVIDAAQLANVHHIILRLPKGYDTLIGGSGMYSLSGGQRQRIALARALYKEPLLLILDEPNSNLDQDGDIALQAAVLAMRKKGAAQLIVSHRPSILQHVDDVMVISDGKIQLYGPREQVVSELQKLADNRSPDRK